MDFAKKGIKVQNNANILQDAQRKADSRQNEFLHIKPAEPEGILKNKANKAEESKKDMHEIIKVIKAKTNNNWKEKREAINALAEFEDPKVAQVLIEVLKKDEWEGARMAAAHALGKLKPSSAIAALIEALKKDGSGGVKNEAAAALANILGHINSINNARILPALADIFRREDSTWIKRRLIGAIANIGGEDAYKILQQISALEMDFYVREAAKEAAAKIKNI